MGCSAEIVLDVVKYRESGFYCLCVSILFGLCWAGDLEELGGRRVPEGELENRTHARELGKRFIRL